MKLPVRVDSNPGHDWGWVFLDAAGEQVDPAAVAAALNSAAWIPVTEKLPDDDITVMIAGKMDEPVWLGFHDDTGWYSVDAMPLRNMVTHWRNLPEPPHG